MHTTELSLLREQKNEITSHLIYAKLAAKTRAGENADILRRMSGDELRHYNELKKITGRDVAPAKGKIVFFYMISRLFGLTFGLKLLEKAEDNAVDIYGSMVGKYPQLQKFVEDEQTHELLLIAMISEEKLNYMGSVVLGLNDALVELTGALAGFTFAFQNTRLIAMTGLITGISASFSMAASEYLSTRQEKGDRAEAIKDLVSARDFGQERFRDRGIAGRIINGGRRLDQACFYFRLFQIHDIHFFDFAVLFDPAFFGCPGDEEDDQEDGRRNICQ